MSQAGQSALRFARLLCPLALLGAIACTPVEERADAGPSPLVEVAIERFSASRTRVTAGDTITLMWSTRAASSCTLSPGFGTVPRSGELQVTPATTTTYTLGCEGGGREVSDELTVEVLGGDAGDPGDPEGGPDDGGADPDALFTLSGDIEEGAPTSSFDELTDGSLIWLVREREGALLEGDLACDGHYPAAYGQDFGSGEPSCLIPAGTRVDSYLLHAFEDESGPSNPSGTVVFEREILALQWRGETLAAGDEALSRPGLLYPGANSRSFGIGSGDAVTLAPDRRTLTLEVEARNVDDLRVITLAEGEEPPLVRSLTLEPTTSTDLRAEALTAEDKARLLKERAVVLEEPLAVDLLVPGRYTSADDPRLGGTLPAGTALQASIVHFDPRVDGGSTVVLSFTLPRPILGLAFDLDTLGDSDDVVRLEGEHFPSGEHTGLELSENETLWLSEDLRSVRARLTVSSSTGIDQFRVFYEVEP